MNTRVAAILLAGILTSGLYAADQSTAPATSQTSPPAAAPPADQSKVGAGTASQQEKPDTITGILDSKGNHACVGLNEKILVQLRTASGKPLTHLDATQYALFFNGQEVKDLPDAFYDPKHQSVVFVLKRTDKNKDLWTSLLGSPSLSRLTRQVTVSLGERPTDTKAAVQSTISGTDGSDTLEVKVLPPWRLGIAILLVAGVIWLVFARARKNTTLRDNLLPQIPAARQTYSLGRWQMAFWFVLVFCSFIFLYIITWDYNTISQQALTLMGISGGTALAAVAIDVAKDSPADAVNRGLRALGFNSYDDVVRVEQEITARQAELQSNPPPSTQRIAQLQIEIRDRQILLRTYEDRIRPFLTQGWFKDLTTDLNGAAVHRLQVFCWTWVLGLVFLIGVYRDLAMPEFSATLLALMGISSAGYVGFKYPEKNN
jgi:hypothetical protein